MRFGTGRADGWRGSVPRGAVAGRRFERLDRRGTATIYQELDLVPHLSVALNVFLGHEQKRGPILNRAAMRRETAALLARLGDEGISPNGAGHSPAAGAAIVGLNGSSPLALGQVVDLG
ncbi:MAG TPA: hypothetical protein VI094_20165 [Propionibacteriaceae bacterium]